MKKLTAKRPIALLLCIVMVLSLIPVLPVAASAENQYKVYDNGAAVTSVAVPQSKGEVTLTAKGEGISAYQWQIKAGDTWVNIRGEKSATLKLRYAMVASLMEGGAAQIRCYTGEKLFTDPITVTLSTEAPTFNTEQPQFKVPTTNKAVATMNAPAETETTPAADNGKAEFDRLNGIYEEAKAAYLAAEQAYNDAVSARNDAQNAVDACAAKVADAEAKLSAAKAPAETAAPTEAAPEGETAETAAPTQAPTVDTAELEKAVNDAKTQLTSAQELLAAKELAVTEAETAKNEALAKKNEAEANKKAYVDAQNNKGTENNKVNGILNAIISGTNTLDEAGAGVTTTHSVVVNYVFADGKQAASPWTSTVADGSPLYYEITSPTVQGYTPSEAVVKINETAVTKDITLEVTYNPALVNYTVKHYKQNLNDDNYTLAETETKQGFTESAVGKELGKKYEGFYSLLYDDTVKIAADGSTVVEIYYDRYYYLMNFDLDGGYGVEPIYARYGAPIEWKTPVKQGYTFAGWTPSASGVDTMPAENRTYKANWNIHAKVPVTVIFWGENPNDEGYSYDHSGSVQATPGEDFSFNESYQFIICGEEEHIHGDDCEYGCGKTNHTHNASCGYACGETEHTHDASCLVCSHTTHDLSCYKTSSDYYPLKETTKPSQLNTPATDGVYTYNTTESGIFGSTYQQPHYYLYLNGKWYAAHGYYSGNLSDTHEITLNCSHTHTASCYKDKEHHHSASCGYACGQEAHQHSAACGMSCGKTEHQHTSACYQTGAGMSSQLWKLVKSDTVTVAADGSSIINVYYDRKEFTLTYINKGNTVGTITDKWGANIQARYNDISNKAGGSMWTTNRNTEGPYTNNFPTMPAESKTYYLFTSSGDVLNSMTYLLQDLENPNNYTQIFRSEWYGKYDPWNGTDGYYTVTDEDFLEFEGFTVDKDQSAKVGDECNEAKFRYTRNSYKLEYMSSGTKLEDKTATVKYEAPLTPYNITPAYPDNLEPGAYTFEGWYTDQYFHNKVDWTTDTMPASDVMVYAHWVPKTHTVTFALDKNAQPGSLAGYPNQTVPHGSKITQVENPTNGSYTFVGWFYTDDNGQEKAFDAANMPVNRDLNLYGKWSANTMVPYTIKYAVQNEDGTLTYIADDTTGNALALTTKTFEAKTGADLYEGYQSGYFPNEASHSIVMSADEGAKNEFTFIYVPKAEVNYTVRYLEQGTGKVLHEEKPVKTRNAIVTETFVPVTGYMPDAYQKRLILSANDEDNVITFWYVEDDTHAPLHIVHKIQNIQGDEYTIYQESTDINAIIGNTYTENPLTIPGFKYNTEKGTASGTMTAEGLELTLYYDRIEYPYEFKFLEQGTDIELAKSVTGNARYQAQVSENAKEIAGYDCVTTSPQAMTIAIEDPANTAKNNVRIFYYQEKKVTIEYKVVGPDGQIDTAGNIGTANPASETIKVRTDVAAGSTAAPKDNTYKFVGWYKDEACTQPVDAAWVTNTTHMTPAKTGDKNEAGEPQTYEAATYYAKFEYNLTSMTISKSGTAYNASDSFIFDVYHGTEKVTTVTMKLGESKTISGLTVGETYTVKERTANTRYTAQDDQYCTLTSTASENTVTFTNSVKNDKWLTSSKTESNVFNGVKG